MLEAAEEYMLATRWRECGDENAALQLLTSHLRLALVVAREDRHHRQSEEALFQFEQGKAPNIRRTARRFAPR
jgi:DNA-directed RNA polymerase sigma subunit (sigma70/sigma32)